MKKFMILFTVIYLLFLGSGLFGTITHIYNDNHLENDYTFTDTVYIHVGGGFHNTGGNHTLTFNSTVINEGIIYDGENSLIVVAKGDIVNSGSWTNYQTSLSESADQHISMSGSGSISSDYFYNYKSSGDVLIDSDISFSNCIIDFQSMKDFSFNGAYTLNIAGGKLYRTTVTGVSGSVLNMSGDAYLQNVDTENMELQGDCQINENVTFSGTTTNTDTLRNRNAYQNWGTLTVNNTFINNGIISDNGSYLLRMSITGDATNNGTWNNWRITLTGISDQHFSCLGYNSFSVLSFYGNTSRGNIYFDTDIEFVGTDINLNEDNVILQSGNTFSLCGGSLHNGTFDNAVLNMSSGAYTYDMYIDNAVLNMSGDSYLRDMTAENTELQGDCQINANVTFGGTTTNTGTLRNRNAYQNPGNLTVNDTFINNGIISNNGSYNLVMYITGNITNNGTWNNLSINLTGTSDQHISSAADSVFTCTNFYNNNSGNIVADTDIAFSNVIIDFQNNGVFDFSNGNDLILYGGKLYRTTVTGAVLNMSGDTYLQDMTAENTELRGDCQINDNVTFSGTTTNTGTLRNRNAYQNPGNLTVNDTFINNGIILNNGSYILRMNITGDVTNNGTWNNYQTKFTGTTNQTISLENGNYITSDVRFVSDVTGSAYQWNHDSVPLDSPNFNGETAVELDWNVPVNGDYTGTYNCVIDDTLTSRDLIVTEPAPPVMEMTLVSADSIAYGNLYVGQNQISEVVIRNDGNVDLSVSDVSFSAGSSSSFSFTYDNLNETIDAGSSDTIFVKFEPDAEGNFTGTLNITNNSTNNPVIQIALSGRGEYDEIPAPQNVQVVLDSQNATINWDAVTQTVHGIPVTPDFYVINYSEIPQSNPDDYYHLTATTDLSIVHIRVIQFAPQMFYQVIAIRDYNGEYGSKSRMKKFQTNKITWGKYKKIIGEK